eukprot:121710-Pyramimonas_sp.AAC.1
MVFRNDSGLSVRSCYSDSLVCPRNIQERRSGTTQGREDATVRLPRGVEVLRLMFGMLQDLQSVQGPTKRELGGR